MISFKIWHERSVDGNEWKRCGWYLFGFVPMFVYDCASRGLYGSPRPVGAAPAQEES